MKKHDLPERKTRGYYKFSKKYPSRHGTSYAIGESRKMRKKERARRILIAVLVVCLFAIVYVSALFFHNLLTRPIPEKPKEEVPVITADNIGTVRAIYINNSLLAEMSDLSEALSEAKNNGFNAVVLDFKTREGYLTYKSNLLKNSDSGGKNMIDRAVIDKIKEEDMTVIARIFCFEDAVAPQRLGAFVYEDAERTKMWFDAPAVEGGKPWLNPTSPAASNYICSVIKEVNALGADAVYLESVQFPEKREGAAQYFTEDDSLINRSLVLSEFIESAVTASGKKPVIIGVPLEGAEGGNAEKWGGNLFDTAAAVCSPLFLKPDDTSYIEYAEGKNDSLNESAKNNFSTITVIPTLKNQPDDAKFYKNIAESRIDSYIIMP